METEDASRRSNRLQGVVVVSITVTSPTPVRGASFRRRLASVHVRHTVRALVAVAIVLAGLGIALALPDSQNSRAAGARRARLSDADRTAIAEALGYPYPLRCLTITIDDSSPAYARANVDRTSGCGRYHGYLNASLHRVDGAWRLVLDEGQLFVPNSLAAPHGTASRRGPQAGRMSRCGWSAESLATRPRSCR
jgi:hypothetical protein